jgi:hypothetical protein
MIIEKEFWIARDEDKRLVGYTVKPKRIKEDNRVGYFDTENNCDVAVLDKSLYPEITWENSPAKAKVKVKCDTIIIKKSGVTIETFGTLEQCKEWINKYEGEDLEICKRVDKTIEIACVMIHDLLERSRKHKMRINVPDSFYQGLKELINEELVIPDDVYYKTVGKFDSERKELIMYE